MKIEISEVAECLIEFLAENEYESFMCDVRPQSETIAVKISPAGTISFRITNNRINCIVQDTKISIADPESFEKILAAIKACQEFPKTSCVDCPLR